MIIIEGIIAHTWASMELGMGMHEIEHGWPYETRYKVSKVKVKGNK
jgi:hypothetical protein